MSVTEEKLKSNDKIIIVNIEGPVTSESSSHFEDLINTILAKGNKYIAVNFLKVDYITSSGIGALISCSKIAKNRSGNLVIYKVSSEIISLFSILGLTKVITIVPDKNEAISFLSKEIEFKHDDFYSPDDHFHESPEIDDNDDETIFENPLVIECAQCNAYVRVHQSGTYICPSCHTEFITRKDGSIVY